MNPAECALQHIVASEADCVPPQSTGFTLQPIQYYVAPSLTVGHLPSLLNVFTTSVSHSVLFY